jgi:hypothetical protein
MAEDSGFVISIATTNKGEHSMLIREGCDGSQSCAMVWYVAEGDNYLSLKSLDLHFNDSELETVYEAIKSVRKERRKA